MKRTPIIRRNSIIPREAVSLQGMNVQYDLCVLCKGHKSCSGYEYCDAESDGELHEHKSIYRLIHVDKDFEDWDALLWQIKVATVLGTNVRLVLDKQVPNYIIMGLSYSPLNIVQINVDLLNLKEYLKWAGYTAAMASDCGVFSIMLLNPLVPTVTKTYHVIEVIDNFRNMGNHVSLKFIDFPDLPVVDEHINFNGTAIPVKYLEKTPDGFVCNEWFMQRFMEIVKSYTVPRKISVSVCNTMTDCSGIGMEG